MKNGSRCRPSSADCSTEAMSPPARLRSGEGESATPTTAFSSRAARRIPATVVWATAGTVASACASGSARSRLRRVQDRQPRRAAQAVGDVHRAEGERLVECGHRVGTIGVRGGGRKGLE